MGEELRSVDDRQAEVIRSHIEALARHPAEEIRCLAYRILLTDETMPAITRGFPSSVDSGLTFLIENSELHTFGGGGAVNRERSDRPRLASISPICLTALS